MPKACLLVPVALIKFVASPTMYVDFSCCLGGDCDLIDDISSEASLAGWEQ